MTLGNHSNPMVLKLFFVHSACEILVPRPGIKPVPLAVEVWSLNHWTAREFPNGSKTLVCIKIT